MSRGGDEQQQQLELPPGFRFHPTDEELVNHYLCRKCASQPLAVPIIREIDLYKFDPWQLPEMALYGEKEWYFFSPRDRKYPNGSRPNRAAGTGYWKATGADKHIGKPKALGIKKALVFYAGKAPKGIKTNWIMHEYRLANVDRSAATAKKNQNLRVAYGVIKEPAPCGPGPWGGDGGRAWDDGVFSGISQIHLTREAEGICSVQIEYDRNGQFIWSAKHGGNGGTSPHRIKLEYPHEVITCISGYYGCISKGQGPKIIKSLTFFTSRGKYGPFGEQVGTFFTSTATEGKVVGFHGRSGLFLDAIGVHMQHWLGSDQKTSHKPSLFKKY